MMRLDIRVTESDVAEDLTDEKVRDGIHEAAALAGDKPFLHLAEDHPALVAYDKLVQEAMDAALPEVRDVILAKFRERLPFEWAEGAWEGSEP